MEFKCSLLFIVLCCCCCNHIVESTAEWTVKPFPLYTPAYGNSLTMLCRIDTPFIGFFFEGEKLESGSRFEISEAPDSENPGKTLVTLKIDAIVDEDYGEYYCNDTDEKPSAKATLHIQASIPALMAEQKLAVGIEGTVSAVVHGMPKNKIIWELSTDNGKTYQTVAELNKNGEQTMGAERYEVIPKIGLVIKEVKSDDAGTYQVSTQSNSAGLIKESTKIITGNKPELKAAPSETYVTTKGLDLKIDCEWLYDDGAPEWIFINRDGQLTELTTGFDNMALTLTNVAPENEGNYTCKAGNEFGNSSTTTEVEQVIIPPEIQTDFKNESKAEGSSYNITCEATGVPLPRVTLSSTTGNELASAFGFVSHTFGSLSLANKASYKCVADNSAKKSDGTPLKDEKEMNLDILTKPMISSVGTTQEKASAVGLNFTIKCSARGNPVPSVKLMKEGNDVATKTENEDGYVIAYFEVFNAVADDFGTLECVASNTQGTNKTNIQVNEVVKAPAPVGLKESRAAGFEYIELEWEKVATADSYIVYLNHTNGNRTAPLNSFIINGLQRNTYYSISVASVNIAGIGDPTKPSIILKTSDIIKPKGVSGFNIISKSSEEVQISWKKPSNIKDEVILYDIKWCKVTNDTKPAPCMTKQTQDTRLELENLEPSTQYNIYVVATNQGISSEPIQFKVESETVPTQLPVITSPTEPPSKSGKGKGGLSSAAVAGVIIAVILIILIVVDLFCCYFNHCGFSHCCFETLCANKSDKKYIPADTHDEEQLTEIKSNDEKTETV